MSSLIEFIHALLMIAWVMCIPFMFWHRWYALSMCAAIYSCTFIVINRVSHYILGECILTRMARWAGGAWDGEWFTVKFVRYIFGFIPTNRQVIYVEQALILFAALGMLVFARDKRVR